MALKTSQQIRVGIFVFIGLILSMLVIFLLGDNVGLFERHYSLNGRFTDISGLRIGAPVFLAGIQVGSVKEIQFPKNLEERNVIVKLEMKYEFQDRIRQDSSTTITTQGLLGDKAIFITVGTPQSKALKNGDELMVKAAISLDSFAEKGGELLDNINNLAKNGNQLIKDAQDERGLLHALVYDRKGTEIISDLAEIARNSRNIVTQVRTGDGILHGLIYDQSRPNLGRVLSDTAGNFNSFSKNLEKVGNKINSGEGSIGGLINDPTVYYDLMTLLGKANRNKLLRTVIRATLATNEKDLEK